MFLILQPVPDSSKLTRSFVNVSLKLQTLIPEICQYFFYLLFFNKRISVFSYNSYKVKY